MSLRLYNRSVCKIRKYRHDDFENAYKLDVKCFEPGIAYTRPELRFYLQHPYSISLVAEMEKRFSGFLVAKRERAGVCHLITIELASEDRKKGIGTKLIESLEAELKALKCIALVLEVAVDNAAALRFYSRHGFSVQKTIPRYYLNRIDALQMMKPIADGAGKKASQ